MISKSLRLSKDIPQNVITRTIAVKKTEVATAETMVPQRKTSR